MLVNKYCGLQIDLRGEFLFFEKSILGLAELTQNKQTFIYLNYY